MSDEKRRSFDATWLPFGMPIGIVLGISIGMAGFGSLLAGAVLGVVLGLLIGVVMGTRRRAGEPSEEDIEDDLARKHGLYGPQRMQDEAERRLTAYEEGEARRRDPSESRDP